MQRSSAIIAVSLVVVGFSVAQIHSSQTRPLRPTQSLSLSDDLTPDTKLQPLPPAPITTVPSIPTVAQPVAAAWQGPIQPLTLLVAPAMAPVFDKIPTTEPVVFLGIDDGIAKDPAIQNWLIGHKLPFTLFLDNDAIKDNYRYFRPFQAAGMAIEDHTLHHPDLTKLPLAQQQAEICGAADTYQQVYGHRPQLFRPPYGAYNDQTKQAAAACGMRAIILWHETLNYGAIQYQDTDHLEPGDIILTHFRSDFVANMQALSAQLNQQHLQVARLEDWLQ